MLLILSPAKTLDFDSAVEEQVQALEVLTASVTQKLLYDPIIFLKRNHHRRKANQELDLVRRLFNLDPDRLEAPPGGHPEKD